MGSNSVSQNSKHSEEDIQSVRAEPSSGMCDALRLLLEHQEMPFWAPRGNPEWEASQLVVLYQERDLRD